MVVLLGATVSFIDKVAFPLGWSLTEDFGGRGEGQGVLLGVKVRVDW